jgi:hypothetical protein
MNHTTFTGLHAALLAKIAATEPALKAVTGYEPIAETAALPRAILEISDITSLGETDGDTGNEQFDAIVAFSIYLVGEARDRPAARLALQTLAVHLAARLNHAHPSSAEHPITGGNIAVKGVYPDIITAAGRNANGANAAAFRQVQRIDADVPVLFKPEPATPTFEWEIGEGETYQDPENILPRP